MFNFTSYIHTLTLANKLLKSHNFKFGTCSGQSELQDAIANFRTESAFLIADTVTTGGTIKKGGSWYQRRTFTFFLFKKYERGNDEKREAALDVCREIRRQILSRILHDQVIAISDVYHAADSFVESRVSFDLNSVASTEYGTAMLSNCTGLYVMINSDEPINMSYNGEEWE